MGQEISIAEFDQQTFADFHQKLKQETDLLHEIARKNGFSKHKPVAGFEIEAWLLDNDMQVAPINEQFLETFHHPLACEELARFNIELNSIPTPCNGAVLSNQLKQLESTWDAAYRHAQNMDKQMMMVGILPTLKQADLTLANMSNRNRYRALNTQILKSRGKPVHLDILGQDHLKIDHNDVMLESSATSLQIHIQLPIDIAHHFYNASIMASAIIVASSANAPFLLGKNLWQETRIPLFEQAIETGGYAGAAQGPLKRVSFGTDYARQSIMECFTENIDHFPVLLPEIMDEAPENFAHLRLHNGTIWRWNRPLVGFDADGAPHIRIEHRSPSAGPSCIDAIANAAFYYGLSQYLYEGIVNKQQIMPFSQAKDNFYQAARFGLDSHILWFNSEKIRIRQLAQRELLENAKQGLRSLGIDAEDGDYFIDIIRQRIENRQTGSEWQQNFIKNTQNDYTRMTQAYLKNQQSGLPVSQWSIH